MGIFKMIVKKLHSVLPNIAASEKEWKIFHPAFRSDVNQDELIYAANSKGLLKLVFGIVYFLSLASALTFLLT
jgi:hypothetical protein